MNVGIVGARKRNDYNTWEQIYKEFEKIQQKHNKIDFIVSGGQKLGADGWAETISIENELDLMVFRAKWNIHGKDAGPIRNLKIAQESDLLLAAPHPEGSGTQNTIDQFKEQHPDGELIVI